MAQIYSAAFVMIVLLALVNTGSTLKCWKCHSEFDVTCRDYFNITRIEENRRYFENFNYGNSRPVQPVRNDPHLEHCDESFAHAYNQKTVCLKRVYRGTGKNDIPNVQRECRLVSKDLKEGQCPEDLTADRSKITDFCSTCELEACNAAVGLKTNVIFIGLLPIFLVLLKN